MMKMNILKNGFQALIIVSLMAACSLGDVLEPSDGVNMALMETVDTVVALPGDTISFKFIASTNGATLRRIEIVEKSHDFNELKDSIRFALVDETLELTVDEEGYLSRPVSTVMMIYPVIVPNDKAIVGEILSMTFKAYNDKGKSGSIKSSFKIVNYVRNTSWLWLYKLAGKIQGSMFFNPAKYKVYSNSSFETHKDEIDVAAYTASDGKHYFMNPADKETQTLFVADGMEYDASTMRTTKFIPLDHVNFDLAGDTELEQMDFSKAVNKIEVITGSVIGFENQDGRRGIMNVKISSSIYPTIQCKFQAVAKQQ